MSVVELVGRVCTRDVAQLSVAEVRASLGEVGRVQAWLDAVKVDHARRLAELAADTPMLRPVGQLADGQRCTRRDADTILRRAATLEGFAPIERAMHDGELTGAHVDALTRATRTLNDEQRQNLGEHAAELVAVAVASTPEEFAREVQRQVRTIVDDDGLDELHRQQRATRLRMWCDLDSGMYRLTGEFDPLTGLAIRNRLDHVVRTLFSEHPPDNCPADHCEKVDHLRALALERLLTAGTDVGVRGDDLVLVGHSYELTILVDERTLREGHHDDSVIDADEAGVRLPVETVRGIACLADVIPIVLDDKGVPLHLGRTTRLASRSQRRALRAMYARCAIPDCSVPARHCQPHHVHWWRHGGETTLDNLLPLCSRHHHLVHEDGWTLTLRPDHSYTIDYPDGSTETVDPPRQRQQSPPAVE